MSFDPDHVTEVLRRLAEAAPEKSGPGAEELLPVVYDELRRLAGSYLRREREGHTLQPTALVHEAYLRMVDQKRVDWRGRSHFFAIGARMMRRLLVDHARERGREKRGGDRQRLTLTLGGDLERLDERVPLLGRPLGREELLDLDHALERFAEIDPRAAQVVELRFFAGLGMAEIAEALRVSKRTAEGDWTHARAWLKRELERPGDRGVPR